MRVRGKWVRSLPFVLWPKGYKVGPRHRRSLVDKPLIIKSNSRSTWGCGLGIQYPQAYRPLYPPAVSRFLDPEKCANIAQ